ncbi:MAG: hypothetical protein JWM26_3079 [Betaproteobacteria bacterium]|nr:hypothetical protein [Betaproteobacteria bacterium]
MAQNAQTISIADEAEKMGGIDPLTKAKIFGLNADTISRAGMVVVIGMIFVGLNWAVIDLVTWAFREDLVLLRAKTLTPADRVITTNVFMSLIGATVVQVGVATISIVSYLFPKSSSGA